MVVVFLPTLLVVYAYLMLRLSPAYFAPPGLARANARRVMMVLFAVLVIGMAINSARRFRALHTYQISAPRGSFLTEPLIGQPLSAAPAHRAGDASGSAAALGQPAEEGRTAAA